MGTVSALSTDNLTSLAHLLAQVEVQSVESCARQEAQQRNLLVELLHFVDFPPVDVVEDRLVVLFLHNGKLAIGAAQD